MQQRSQRRMNSQPSTVFASVRWIAVLALLLATSGCGRSRRIEVIDLDKVLNVLDTVMKSPVGGGGSAPDPAANTEAGSGAVEVARIDPDDEKAELTAEFLTKFSAALNEAQLMSQSIGVLLEESGAMLGFTDYNSDNKKSGSDRGLFRIEVDTEAGRVIATDLQRPQYRRDHYYGSSYYGHRYHGGGGFFMGYMLGSMSGRSHHYYGGSSSRRRPSYSAMNMSSPGYQRSALQSAKTKARAASAARARSSARSRGGSFSFRSGK